SRYAPDANYNGPPSGGVTRASSVASSSTGHAASARAGNPEPVNVHHTYPRDSRVSLRASLAAWLVCSAFQAVHEGPTIQRNGSVVARGGVGLTCEHCDRAARAGRLRSS